MRHIPSLEKIEKDAKKVFSKDFYRRSGGYPDVVVMKDLYMLMYASTLKGYTARASTTPKTYVKPFSQADAWVDDLKTFGLV